MLISCISLIVMIAIINLVRRKRVDEKYALLWLAAGTIMMLAPFATGFIDKLSHAIGIYYPPSLVFLAGFLALCLINLQFSAVISRLTKDNRRLAQQFAILEDKLKDLKRLQ